MTKLKQTEDELLAHLKEQIGFLLRSANSYDNGFIGESKRLALTIRVLLHDTGSSPSLLTQLGKKNIGFYDTCIDYNPRNLAPHMGLIMMKLSTGSGAEYVAPLDNLSPPRMKGKVSIHDWWNKIVFKDTSGNLFTRGEIIKTLANKEGGAHVDPELDADYVNLSKFNSLGWKSVVRKGDVIRETDIGNPVLPSMRQIAFEVIRTLKDEFPDIFPE